MKYTPEQLQKFRELIASMGRLKAGLMTDEEVERYIDQMVAPLTINTSTSLQEIGVALASGLSRQREETSAFGRSLRIEKSLRSRDDVKDCEVTLVETREREHHIAKVLLQPETELIELDIPPTPTDN